MTCPQCETPFSSPRALTFHLERGCWSPQVPREKPTLHATFCPACGFDATGLGAVGRHFREAHSLHEALRRSEARIRPILGGVR